MAEQPAEAAAGARVGQYARLQDIEEVCTAQHDQRAGAQIFSCNPAITKTPHVCTVAPLQRVVRAIEAASFVMGELAKEREDMDKNLLHAGATAFLDQIQV